MLFFIRQFDDEAQKGRFRFDLLLSCLCFLFATWARIEGVMFLLVSPAYLLIAPFQKKIERFCCFVAPIAFFGAVVVIAAHTTGHDLMASTRIQKVYHEASQFTANYDTLESQIKAAYGHQRGLYAKFLQRTREILIFIPLISIVHNLLEGVFYPFALIYFIGFWGLHRRYRQNQRFGYFLWLSLGGFILLYIHMIQTWIISYRFLAVLIYPGCVIMANGIEQVMEILVQKRRWPAFKAGAAIAAFLIIFGLPKNLKPEERDKIVYRQTAQRIAMDKQPDEFASVYATQPRRAFEWVLLYAHRRDPVLRCSKTLIIDVPDDYEAFIRTLDSVNARYFFYEKRNWPKNRFDLMAARFEPDLRILGQWKHPDSGTLVLFERLMEHH